MNFKIKLQLLKNYNKIVRSLMPQDKIITIKNLEKLI